MRALAFGWCAGLSLIGSFGQGANSVRDSQAGQQLCRLLEMSGEVEEGQEWSLGIGEGWVFRVIPISPPGGVSQERNIAPGWDLVVDRIGSGAGYPDALLLATPPYGSLNEREIGTTFGLRAQDALGWGPRHFRFFDSVEQLSEGRKAFRDLTIAAGDEAKRETGSHLIELIGKAASGEFRVTDAKLVPGKADPVGFAQRWGANLANLPHTVVQQSGEKSELGEIRWIRFEIRLWLPQGWKIAGDSRSKQGSKLAKCAQ